MPRQTTVCPSGAPPLSADLEPDPTPIPTTLRPILDDGEGKQIDMQTSFFAEPPEREENSANDTATSPTTIAHPATGHIRHIEQCHGHEDERQNPLGPGPSLDSRQHRTRSCGGDSEVNTHAPHHILGRCEIS